MLKSIRCLPQCRTVLIPVPPSTTPNPLSKAAWDDTDTLLQLPGVGPTQAARLRSKRVATLRELALRGEAAAKSLLESSGLAPADGSGGGRGRGGRGSAGGGGGGGGTAVAAAMRALSAIPVVKDVTFGVRAAGGDGADGVSSGICFAVYRNNCFYLDYSVDIGSFLVVVFCFRHNGYSRVVPPIGFVVG